MNWNLGQLKIDTTVKYPSDKKLQDKYFIGTSLLIKHKDKLLESKDPQYQTFISLYEKITAHTMLDFDRAYMLYQAVLSTQNLVGCTAECGVYKGGISLLIASLSPEKKHYALDTFEGMPNSISSIDSHRFGDLSIPKNHNILNLFKSQSNICMLKGAFSSSFDDIQDRIFSFVYIDADLYTSTLECCNFFYPRLTSGGIMLFDDYLVDDTRGVKKAVDEFFEDKRTMPLVLPTSQAIVYQI